MSRVCYGGSRACRLAGILTIHCHPKVCTGSPKFVPVALFPGLSSSNWYPKVTQHLCTIQTHTTLLINFIFGWNSQLLYNVYRILQYHHHRLFPIVIMGNKLAKVSCDREDFASIHCCFNFNHYHLRYPPVMF